MLDTVTILPQNLIIQFIPLLYVFRSYQLQFRAQYISSMYLKYLKTVYQPILKNQFEDVEEFLDDFFELKDLFFETVKSLDENLEEFL